MNSRIRILIPVLIVAVAGVVWWRVDAVGHDDSVLASGTVEATEAQLSFQAAGRIVEMHAREGDGVEAGALLATLDTVELAANRRLAQAQLDAARANLRAMEAGSRPAEIAGAEAAASAARAQYDEAVRERQRAERLYEGGAVSAQAVERARTAEGVAEAGLQQATDRLSLVREGPRRETVEAARAAAAQADAGLARAEAMLQHTRITAPFSGVIAVRYREPGEAVAPGVPVLSLRSLNDRWVRIYVREDRVGTVRLGQAAEIRTDSWPDRVFQGVVDFISGEAEFTPRAVQTTEERTKLVYAVKVRIEGDEEGALKPGLPADVQLWTESGDGVGTP
ncbi:MAG: HlyD family efflux transporter periplasmic adaptor subunit [Gemmatimonadetes bacterium]|nr:HlyD family efflux transporter periplasmic adaptor subunit [Gemmatimonadota bacterium]